MDATPLKAGESYNHLLRGHNIEQRMYAVTLSFDELSLRIVDGAKSLDISATLSGATLQLAGKTKETCANARCSSLLALLVHTYKY
jgi:hypothetical protein